MSTSTIRKHSLPLSILLHLLPGILTGAVYYALVPVVTRWGYPTIMALVGSSLLTLIPFELGLLLYLGKQRGTRRLEGVVLYRQKLPVNQYLIWVPVIFVSSGLILTLLTPVSDFLMGFFLWIPEKFMVDMGLGGGYSKAVLILTYALSFLLVTVVGPTVEELYFRGYLLPRMPDCKGWFPLLHTALFALYHTWTPWLAAARTAAVLPLVYIVRWKKNLLLGIIAHVLLNSIDIVIGVVFILHLS